MGQLLSIILIVVFGFLILSIILLQFYPAKWKTEGEANIRSLQSFVFNQLASPASWPSWHVWMLNGKSELTSEQTQGLGARIKWKSELIKGEMTIVQSDPPGHLQAHFVLDPLFELTAQFLLKSEADNSTTLTWKLFSKSDSLNPLRKLQIAALKSSFRTQMEASISNLAENLES